MVQSNSISSEGPSSVEILRRRESCSYYKCCDYLAKAAAATTTSSTKTPKQSPTSVMAFAQDEIVDVSTRAEMLEWVSKVTLFLKLNEDISILTATLLDRFLQTPYSQEHILTSVPNFRLATMACFYLTAKIHEHACFVSSEVMAAFSHGVYSPQQVEDMEVAILNAMGWNINPPTALTFCREFLLLLPCSISAATKEHAQELCVTQIQRAMLDYDAFATVEASTIAFFSVKNALQSLGMDEIVLSHVLDIFSYATHSDYSTRPAVQSVLSSAIAAVVPAVVVKRSSSSSSKPGKKVYGRSSSLSSRFNASSSSLADVSPCGVVEQAV